MKKVFIWVNHQQRGVHCYPDAQTQDNLKDVSYLGFKHHHMFMFKIGLEVFHDNRDVEFHQFLTFIESLFKDNVIDIDYKSCEMLADDLYTKISEKYPNRKVKITVSEDGLCGVDAEYDF